MMLGRALVTALALALIATGVAVAWTGAPLSGSTIGAVLLIGAGGGLLAQMIHVARRTP